MLELVNLSNDVYDTANLLQGKRENLETLLRQHGLDGIEMMFCEPWDKEIHPARLIQGVHLRFWPCWLDFWHGNEGALLAEFGTLANVELQYGTLQREAWLQHSRENIRQAVKCGARYVVMHVANARASELYARQFACSDEEVIAATAEVVNEIAGDLPEHCRLLFENLWWPGLTLCQPHLAELLLQSVRHRNSGFMLDTGHLMNTYMELKNEEEAVAYILQVVGGLGELRRKIFGVHLHASLSGAFVKNMMQRPSGRQRRLSRKETMAYVLRVDQHQPFRSQAVQQLISAIQPEYLVHEFMQESYDDWCSKIRRQRQALGWE